MRNFIIKEFWKTDDVFSKIYENMNNNVDKSVLLTLHDEEIDQLYTKSLKIMTGKLHTYYSIDYAKHEV